MKWFRDTVAFVRSGGKVALISRGVFWVLLATVLLSPIPFGSIYAWSYTFMALLVAVLVAVWSILNAVSRSSISVDLRLIWLPAGIFALLCIWISVQAASWTPSEWHHPVWKSAALALGSPVQGHISLNPAATGNALMRLIAYAGIFFLAIQYGRSATDAKRVLFAITAFGLVYAGYGLFIEFTGSESILWYEKERYHDNVTSTFRYKNAYATYAGLGLLCTIGLLIRSLSSMPPSAPGIIGAIDFVSHLFARQWFLLVCLIILLTALVLSDSRAGVASTTVAVISLLLISKPSIGADRRQVTWLVMAIMAALLAFTALSGGGLIDRVSSEENKRNVRAIIYDKTIDLISDHPILGTGYGTYADAFRPVRTDDIAASTARAHNSYLENQLELGAIGMTLLVILFVSFAVRLVRGVRDRRADKIFPAIGCAAFILAALHATIDFTLQVPAVTATFFLIMGVAYGQSWTTRQLEDNRR